MLVLNKMDLADLKEQQVKVPVPDAVTLRVPVSGIANKHGVDSPRQSCFGKQPFVCRGIPI